MKMTKTQLKELVLEVLQEEDVTDELEDSSKIVQLVKTKLSTIPNLSKLAERKSIKKELFRYFMIHVLDLDRNPNLFNKMCLDLKKEFKNI